MTEKLMRLPPGFRFHPTDEELVVQYLKRKAFWYPLPAGIIPEIELRRYDPWELPGCHEGAERYFFNLQEPKYRGGTRLNRAAKSGYWKTTGKDRPVVSSKRNEVVGMKKTLMFHQGKLHQGVRTHWIMHEYRLALPQNPTSTTLHGNILTQRFLAQCEAWVVCRIFIKRSPKTEEDIRWYHTNLRVQHTMSDDRYFRHPSPPPSSCVTDLSDEECSNGEEASSKFTAFSP